MDQLSEILRTARAKEKLSQKDVGDKLGISQRAYAFYEDGTRVPKWSRLLELGAILGIEKVRLLELYDEEGEANDTIPPTEKLSGASNHEINPMQLLATLTDGFKAIAETMKSIESKMAQESTQAKIDETVRALKDKAGELDTNLIRTLAVAERIAIVQDRSQIELLDHLAELRSHKTLPSKDENKSRRRTDGDGHKRGKSPA